MSCITELLKMKGDKVFLPISDNVVIEGGGSYKGYEYLVTFTGSGNRCGYVALDAEHPFNKSIDEDNYGDAGLAVHGGVTFAGREHDAKALLGDNHCDDLWIGFDAAHSNDMQDLETMKLAFPNSRMTAAYLEDPRPRLDYYATVKSLAYMEEECRGLINQLIRVQEEENKKWICNTVRV